MAVPAVFLDRDGVLNKNRANHVRSWDEFRFLPGVLRALRILNQLDVPIVVVTNQAIVNRGDVPQAVVDGIHRRMRRRVEKAGGRIDGVYSCPHTPDEGCSCRKPEPGLLLQAAGDLEIDLTRSVFVGDALTDIQAGNRIGCRTILVRTGRGRASLRQLAGSLAEWPDAVADDLLRATPSIAELMTANKSLHWSYPTEWQEPVGEGYEAPGYAADIANAAFGH